MSAITLQSTNQEPLKDTPHSGRMLQLDFLRGMAILLVLGRHTPVQWHEAGPFKLFAGVWNRCGWSGVDLFFVLSGFLVGGLLFKELHRYNRMDVKRFIIRRGFKIWPSYYLSVLVASFLVFLGNGHHFGSAIFAFWPNYFHVQNYFYRQDAPSWQLLGPTWSLAIEEHFYLALPLLLLIITRKSRNINQSLRLVPFLAVGIMLACTLARIVTAYGYGLPTQVYGIQTHLRVDSLFCGVMLAYLYHFRRLKLEKAAKNRRLLLLAGLLLISPVMIFDLVKHPLISTLGYAGLYAGYGLILIVFVFTQPGTGLLGRFLNTWPARTIAGVGFYSYTIYLWHIIIAHSVVVWLLPYGTPGLFRWIWGTAIFVVLACVTGALAGRLVDLPMLTLRDRLFPSRVHSAAEPEPITPA